MPGLSVLEGRGYGPVPDGAGDDLSEAVHGRVGLAALVHGEDRDLSEGRLLTPLDGAEVGTDDALETGGARVHEAPPFFAALRAAIRFPRRSQALSMARLERKDSDLKRGSLLMLEEHLRPSGYQPESTRSDRFTEPT